MGLRNGLDIKVTRYRTRNKIMIFNFAFCLISVMVHHHEKYKVHGSTVVLNQNKRYRAMLCPSGLVIFPGYRFFYNEG